MNARLYQPTEGRDGCSGGDTGDEGGGNIIPARDGSCLNPRGDNWITKPPDYVSFNEHHVSEINFTSRESSNLPLPLPHEAMVASGNQHLGMLPGNIAATFSNVTHMNADAGPRARDIAMPIKPPYVPGNSCNIAPVLRNNGSISCNRYAPACTVTPSTSANCNNNTQALPCNINLLAPQSESPTRTAMNTLLKNCQLGPVDMEDLAMCFDWSADGSKSSSTSSRAIHTRRSKQAMRTDQSQRQDPYNLCPCDNLIPDDLGSEDSLRFSDLAANDPRASYDLRNPLEYRDAHGSFRSGELEFNNNLGFGDPRGFGIPCDFDGPCGLCGPGPNHQACASRPHNWFCADCPKLFDFCNEERWLQCPASDRCPLYDTSYDAYDTVVLPPCMYENLQPNYDSHENWYYDYAEDEQLLEDYLSNEKRKERSRDAARCRRSRETDIFAELAAALPITPEQAVHLDKASVMRLAIAYLKVRTVVDSVAVPLAKSESSSAEMDELFPKALNGFMLVLSSNGNMIYLSENVSDYLGISQMDMMGQSVYEYSHPCDHDELRECLSLKLTEGNDEKRTYSFFLRFKCTLTSKGRKVNLKSASYKVIHCTGRLANIRDSNSNSMEVVDDEQREREDESDTEYDTGVSLILVGCPIPHPSNIEIPLGRHTFLSKHSLSMKFTYADEKLAEYLGWHSEELVGRSVFEFYHALDNSALDKCFKCLFSKGQCETVAYRFLGKRGGYAWVVTQATLIHCSKQQKPISVVCVNYVLSEVEHEDEVYSVRQLAARDSDSDLVKSERTLPALVPIGGAGPEADSTRLVLDDEETDAADSHVDDESKSEDRPLAVTASIFRSAGAKDEQERKDASPRPVQEKAFVQALKESLEESIKESLKENDQPAPTAKRQDCRPLAKTTPFVFQGKPAVERDSSHSTGRRDQPQAVTRHLFAPLPLTAQQQQQQQQQQEQQQQPQLSCRPSPQTATASIFAPRTEDMNKGFLTFSEDQPGLTMLKDEPEDLTHLAPTAGDVCVPLEDTPFLSDMLDEFIFGNDHYNCPLLSPNDTLTPELRSADLSESLKDADLVDTGRIKDTANRLADSDPFMYGDSPGSPCSIDPSAVSPSFSKYQQISDESPERSVDSLGSPTAGSGGDALSEDEMLMLGISDSMGDDEMALRAPYIPMSDQDEALELLISDNMVMWDTSQSVDRGPSKWLLDDREQRGSESSLAQLLRTDQMILRRYNDHGGGLMYATQILGQQTSKKDTTFESDRWSSNEESTDRPSNKRIHPGLNVDSGSEHKRLKCEDSLFERINFEDALTRQQRSSPTTLHKRSVPILGNSAYGSQLLRRLVSSQTSSSIASHAISSNDDGKHRHDTSEQHSRVLDDIIDLAEAEGDRGGGGGGGESHGGSDSDSLDKFDAINRRKRLCVPGGSSVLMNLLVSGCDDPLMNCRNVPTLIPKNLTSPLSVSVDNQMVPQCTSKNDAISLPDHLSPDTRKHLIGPFTGGGGGDSDSGGTTPIISPTTSAGLASFDSFDYDDSAGLLQVGQDLLGGLLEPDRSLV